MAAGVLMMLVLVLSACGQQATPTSSTPGQPNPTTSAAKPQAAGQEPIKKVLNPQGVFIPVETKPCAPRIDSLNGKKILYYESEATNMHMPTLLDRLKKDYPTATFDVIHVENFGDRNPTADQLKHDAVIRGVGW
jgi:hypothetical protein